MKKWADRAFHVPVGFHSSDNGAIHLELMEWFIGMNNTKVKQCFLMYSELKDPVTNLKSYWNFVNCARRTLGMGEWEGAYKNNLTDPVLKKFRDSGLELNSNDITLKIYPRFKVKFFSDFAICENKSHF